MCFIGKMIRAKSSKDGNLANLKVEIVAIKGPMVVIGIVASIFEVDASRLRRPSDTVDLEDLPDSRERT